MRSVDEKGGLVSLTCSISPLEHAKILADRREVKSADYMNLHFMVKRFYDTSVKIIPEAKNSVPEYPK